MSDQITWTGIVIGAGGLVVACILLTVAYDLWKGKIGGLVLAFFRGLRRKIGRLWHWWTED